MTQQGAQVTATVVNDPITAFIGTIQRIWYAQDMYALLIGIGIGFSCLLIFFIYKVFKKT